MYISLFFGGRMFKRSLLSLVLVTAFVCPAAISASEDELVSVVAEAVTEVAPEAAGIAAQALQLIKDNKLALGAGVVATAGAVALAAWYYGYFQTAENNQAENN